MTEIDFCETLRKELLQIESKLLVDGSDHARELKAIEEQGAAVQNRITEKSRELEAILLQIQKTREQKEARAGGDQHIVEIRSDLIKTEEAIAKKRQQLTAEGTRATNLAKELESLLTEIDNAKRDSEQAQKLSSDEARRLAESVETARSTIDAKEEEIKEIEAEIAREMPAVEQLKERRAAAEAFRDQQKGFWDERLSETSERVQQAMSALRDARAARRSFAERHLGMEKEARKPFEEVVCDIQVKSHLLSKMNSEINELKKEQKIQKSKAKQKRSEEYLLHRTRIEAELHEELRQTVDFFVLEKLAALQQEAEKAKKEENAKRGKYRRMAAAAADRDRACGGQDSAILQAEVRGLQQQLAKRKSQEAELVWELQALAKEIGKDLAPFLAEYNIADQGPTTKPADLPPLLPPLTVFHDTTSADHNYVALVPNQPIEDLLAGNTHLLQAATADDEADEQSQPPTATDTAQESTNHLAAGGSSKGLTTKSSKAHVSFAAASDSSSSGGGDLQAMSKSLGAAPSALSSTPTGPPEPASVGRGSAIAEKLAQRLRAASVKTSSPSDSLAKDGEEKPSEGPSAGSDSALFDSKRSEERKKKLEEWKKKRLTTPTAITAAMEAKQDEGNETDDQSSAPTTPSSAAAATSTATVGDTVAPSTPAKITPVDLDSVRRVDSVQDIEPETSQPTAAPSTPAPAQQTLAEAGGQDVGRSSGDTDTGGRKSSDLVRKKLPADEGRTSQDGSQTTDSQSPATPERKQSVLGRWKRSASKLFVDSPQGSPAGGRSSMDGESPDSPRTPSAKDAADLLKKLTIPERLQINKVIRGSTMMKHGRSGQPHPRQVKLWPTLDGVEWCEAGKDRAPDAFMSIFEMTEVVKGKSTKVFQRAKEVEEDVCFSIVSAKRTLDLQAESATQRNEWVSALDTVLTKVKPMLTATPAQP